MVNDFYTKQKIQENSFWKRIFHFGKIEFWMWSMVATLIHLTRKEKE